MSPSKNNYKNNSPEFDPIAAAYDGGIDAPVKKMLGKDMQTFQEQKAKIFLSLINSPNSKNLNNKKLLDFGCGTGEFVHTLHTLGFHGELSACDVSSAMLDEGKKRGNFNSVSKVFAISETNLQLTENTYDHISAVCVFHHIPKERHLEILQTLQKSLKQNGTLTIFEHNPFNPLTQYIVKNTPLDANAVLLRAAKLKRQLLAAGFSKLSKKYFLFFPPRIAWLQKIDKLIYFLPLGGQYYIHVQKTPQSD